MNVDQKPTGLMAYVNSEGRIRYDKPMQVTSICNLDIFYFPFDEQNCTLTFSSFIHTGEWGLYAVGYWEAEKGFLERTEIREQWGNLPERGGEAKWEEIQQSGQGAWEHLVRLSCLGLSAVENMVLGMEKEVQKISSTSQNLIQSKGEWVLLSIHQRKMKMTVNANQYDQIVFYVSSGALVMIFF